MQLKSLLKATKYVILQKNLTDSIQLLVIQSGKGVSGFIKSFFQENNEINTLVINTPINKVIELNESIKDEVRADNTGYTEIFYNDLGQRELPYIQSISPEKFRKPTSHVVNENDIIVITGGGQGISAECAYQLALDTRCKLLLIGRSDPVTCTELSINLKRFHNADIKFCYRQADITNMLELTDAIDNGVKYLEHTTITGIIHGAAINTPSLVEDLNVEDIQSTISPKVVGFKNILRVVEKSNLKLVANFSSIIGRTGMKGESDYALANDWLSHETNAFKSEYPNCRCRTIEWSAWSAVGMAHKMGSINAMIQQGITPISVDVGVREFLRIISTPDLPTSMVVSGRLGTLETISFEEFPQQPLRFIESILVYYPKTELIAECHLSVENDPYLVDHTLNNEHIFPAVMAIEALTEAVSVLMGISTDKIKPAFHDLAFRRAIIIPKEYRSSPFTLRLIAQAEITGEITLAVRCSATNFTINHIEASCTLEENQYQQVTSSERKDRDNEESYDTANSLYENVLFQRGKFKRIQNYTLIEARKCRANLLPSTEDKWFSYPLPQVCLLGDAGARDAAIHAIQACVPHKVMIPVSVGRIKTGKLDPISSYQTLINEIEDCGDHLTYDVTIIDEEGREIELWHKLKLRAINEQNDLYLGTPELIATFMERKIRDLLPQVYINVTTRPLKEHENVRAPINDVDHRPDGKPVQIPHSISQSVSYCGQWKLLVSSNHSVGCDLECVQHRHWQSLIGTQGLDLAHTVASMTSESIDTAATRIWTVREAMKKAGLAMNSPVVLDFVSSRLWIIFKSGKSFICSSLIDSPRSNDVHCVSIALLSEDLSIRISETNLI